MKSEIVGGRHKPRAVVTLVATAVALGTLLVPLMIGSPAGASPRLSSATTICAMVADGPGNCVTTTTASGATTTIPSISIGTLGLQSSTPKSTSTSSLAFTGTDIALLLIAAALLILIGYAIVRVNRQRRHVH